MKKLKLPGIPALRLTNDFGRITFLVPAGQSGRWHDYTAEPGDDNAAQTQFGGVLTAALAAEWQKTARTVERGRLIGHKFITLPVAEARLRANFERLAPFLAAGWQNETY